MSMGKIKLVGAIAAAAAALVAVTAQVAVEHDGERYGPNEPNGADFELSEAQAKPLIDCGAVKLAVAEVDDGGAGGAAA
jgi:hypothetical protein